VILGQTGTDIDYIGRLTHPAFKINKSDHPSRQGFSSILLPPLADPRKLLLYESGYRHDTGSDRIPIHIPERRRGI
jgi:hypothetical protein